jgi:hypothetical protein
MWVGALLTHPAPNYYIVSEYGARETIIKTQRPPQIALSKDYRTDCPPDHN